MPNRLKYWFYRLQFNHPELFNHKPIHLDLEVSRICNLKCPFCYRQDPKFEAKFTNKYMPTDTAIGMLKKYYSQGMRSVKLNWRGEPLCHGAIGTIANAARKIGYLDVLINTNLALPLVDDFLDNLDSFTEIRVSLDTMIPELYSKMRTPARLENTIANLLEIIRSYDPNKTRLIIQRRTTDECESTKDFKLMLWNLLSECSHEIADEFDEYVKVISKPSQPRISSKMADNVSYFDQWQAGVISRQYCKQPSQRIVVGVDGKEWACCLAYNEHHLFSAKWRDSLIGWLIPSEYNDADYLRIWKDCIPPECLRCTSFTAYKEKK